MQKRKPTKYNRPNPFDFDYWKQLAERIPEKFENHRTHAINEIIDSSPLFMQKRLRGLQWRIDMEIRRSKNTMDSCIRINRMMINSVYASDGLVESVRKLGAPADLRTHPLADAVVIPFRRQSGL